MENLNITSGPRDHSYVPLLQTFNKTNIDERIMILMHHVVPKVMGENAELTIVLNHITNISSNSYLASGQGDRSIILNGWSKVVDVYDMDIGDRMIFGLHHGREGNFLFLGIIVVEPYEE
ncbi:Serine/threonine-protein kinase CTR1 [Hordeum vulgare]|nr:Serine/threonine-protein kinase CTR1 [Hordeum vulgare]